MRVSWQWVAQAAFYFGIAWIAATTLIGVFLLGLKFSLASAFFVAPFLLILGLCLLGLRDIVTRFNEAFGPRKTQRQGKGFPGRVSWASVALIAVYGALAWMAAGTAIGEFLVFMTFSLAGVVVVLAALLILTLCLLANLQNRKQSADANKERPPFRAGNGGRRLRWL